MRRFGTALPALLLVPALAPAAGPVDYRKEIRPILQARCYACHGSLKQNAKLRVDSGANMLKAGVVVPGKPDESELLARVTAKDDATRMPPEGHPLTAEQMASLRTWIEQGAPVPPDDRQEPDPRDHWSFRAVQRPPVPRSRDPKGSGTNPVDALIAAKWAEKGLTPVPPADKRTLLRRVYLDLTGLPPTPEQTAALLKDTSPDAYEKVVDALLASPQYGERWGRHFLDIWRYSDWWGLGAELRNSQKHIWHWRDWTIESLNADVGYDEMVRQMLAADELYPTDPKKLRATGYLARPYFLFNRTTWLDEVIEHTGKGFLGLTLNCTKCHDHKYDPISQANYYQFRALFEPYQLRTDLIGGELDPEKGGIPRAFDCNLNVKTPFHVRGDERNPDPNREIKPGLPAFLAPNGLTFEPVKLPPLAARPGMRPELVAAHRQAAAAKLAAAQAELHKAREALATAAKLAAKEPKAPTPNPKPPARIEPRLVFKDDFAKANPELWESGPGVWKYEKNRLAQQKPDGERSHYRAKPAVPPDFQAKLTFVITGGAPYQSVGLAFDATAEADTLVYVTGQGQFVRVAYKQGGNYVYPADGILNTPIPLNKPIELTVKVRGPLVNVALDGKHAFAYTLPIPRRVGKLDLVTYAATAEFTGIEVKDLPKDAVLVAAAGKTAPAGPPTVEKAKAALAAAEKAVAAAMAEVEKAEQAAAHAGDPKFALRGSVKTRENNLDSAATTTVTFPDTSTGRRTALAKWMTDRQNPLTARVAVNHIWLRHFGQPLVPTVFDFGRKGTPPTHPELLDWLAAELMDHNWSLKHLHKVIVTSNVYRLSSSSLNATEETKLDPENRYLWRMNPVRMQAQVVRDSLLHLAGDLDPTAGGPPVPIPEQDASRRRSLYFFHSHNEHNKLLGIFDDANVLECYRRTESIVPQQALALSNSRFALTMAGKLNDRLHARLGKVDDPAFINAAFETILCANPTPDEMKACEEALTEIRAALKDVPDPDRTKRARLQLVQALVNHNDFVTVR